jgi:Ca-activated chloride channel family protein
VDVRVQTKASGEAEQRLAAGWTQADGPEPTVWTPAASTWIQLLRTKMTAADKNPVVEEQNPSLVATPVVFAMPEPMARALGWPDKPVGWKTLSDLAVNPQGWASLGHPEWGKFTLGKTNPYVSTSGLSGTIGEYYAATGLTTDMKAADVVSDPVRQSVAAVESAVTHYGDTTLTFLDNQYRTDQTSSVPYVSAVVVEEKSVADYNNGNPSGGKNTAGAPPRTKLVAVQPAEGTLYSDNPYAVLNATWVTEQQKQAAEDFYDYLKTPESTRVFTDAGFRTSEGVLGERYSKDSAFTAAAPTTVLSPPSGDIINTIQQQWRELRKKAKIMVVLDVSGSMDENAGDGRTKLERATAAVQNSLSEFNNQDEVGLAVFTTGLEDGVNRNYKVLAPVAPMTDEHRAQIAASLKLLPLNGTPLYDAVALAQTDAKNMFDPNRINAVVVLTDGKNEDPDSITLDALLQQIGTTAENRSTNVKVFSIGYGKNAAMGVLKQISESTGASAYDATDPANIDKVLTSVMSNF